MAIQYIGARYVPKFFENSATGTAEWASNTQYEPLTIVTYNGNSYTSKKRVPASVGNPSANAEYWASTGLFNDQVESLRTDLEDLKAETEDGFTKIGYPKRYIFITDSYGAVTYENKTLPELIAGYLGLTSADYINLQRSGAGFTMANNVATFYTVLSSAVIENHDTVSDIVVLGGANDFNMQEADITAAIETFCNYCKAEYPNAKIHIGYTYHTFNNRGGINNHHNAFTAYSKCARYGAEYLDGVQWAMTNSNMQNEDHTHPNSAGVLAIATAVAQALDGGTAPIVYNNTKQGTPLTIADQTITASGYYDQSVLNGVAKISGAPNNAITITFATAQSISSGGHNYSLLDFSEDPVIMTGFGSANAYQKATMPGVCILTENGTFNLLASLPCSLYLDENNHLCGYFNSPNAFSNVKYVRFYPTGTITGLRDYV